MNPDFVDEQNRWLAQHAMQICPFEVIKQDSLGYTIAFVGNSDIVNIDISDKDLSIPCECCDAEVGQVCSKQDEKFDSLGVELFDKVHKSRNLAVTCDSNDPFVKNAIIAALELSKAKDSQIVFKLAGVTMYIVSTDKIEVQKALWQKRVNDNFQNHEIDSKNMNRELSSCSV